MAAGPFALSSSSWFNPSSIAQYGTMGASNPTGAYLQAGQATGSIGSTGSPPVAGGAAPQSWMGQKYGNAGIGLNLPTLDLALGGIQTIGNLWAAFEANKLAKQQFSFQKGVTETNLKNQIQAYNTTLEDRGRSRAFTESQSPGQAQAYIDQNRLSR